MSTLRNHEVIKDESTTTPVKTSTQGTFGRKPVNDATLVEDKQRKSNKSTKP